MANFATILATVLACMTLLSVVSHAQADVLFRNEGSYNSGLLTEQLSSTGILEVLSGVKCNDGACTRMTNNGIASKGAVYRLLSTVGYTDVTVKAVVKTKLLDENNYCGLWVRSQNASGDDIWTEGWRHNGPQELDWTNVTAIIPSGLLNTGFKIGNGNFDAQGNPNQGEKDYCYMDRVEVTGLAVAV